jgi:hypothetical protein
MCGMSMTTITGSGTLWEGRYKASLVDCERYNKIKVLKRRSYGIKNLGNLFRRIWLDLRGYEAFAH